MAVYTTGSTPTGSYTLVITGTDGTLTHTSNAVLNVQGAAVPTVSASPNSGSGASQTFTFTAAGQGGNSDPTYMNVLFNAAVNGQNGCWLYFDGNFVSARQRRWNDLDAGWILRQQQPVHGLRCYGYSTMFRTASGSARRSVSRHLSPARKISTCIPSTGRVATPVINCRGRGRRKDQARKAVSLSRL